MAELRFNRVAKAYSDLRPGYPARVYETIQAEAGVDQFDLVVDVGSGTGASLAGLQKISGRIMAIEPSDQMRAEAQGKFPHIDFLSGVGEATGLEKEIADLVTVVTAFHWFDREKALDEFHRILKPGGWIALYRYDFPIIRGEGHLVIHRHMTRFWRKFMTRRLTDYDDSFELVQASPLYEKAVHKSIEHEIRYFARDFAAFFRTTSYASRYLESLVDPDGYIEGLAGELQALHPEGFQVAFDLDFIMARKPAA